MYELTYSNGGNSEKYRIKSLYVNKLKSGKTTAATQFPKALLCAFEKGYNAIGGIKPVDINRWSDFKLVLRQLDKPEAREMYETIVIDTVSIAWNLCEEYICAQNGVQKISDVAWGGGYAAAKKEFENTLRRITQMGYGVVLIAHSAIRIEKDVNDNDIEIISPELPKRAYEICNGIVDIIGYIGSEWTDGEQKRWLYTRETPTLFAGSRFKYINPKIPFGYDELVKAVSDAIEKAEKLDGAIVVDNIEDKFEKSRTFEEVRGEARELWTKLIEKDEANEARVLKKIEMIFGRKMRLSEITEDQTDLFELVVEEMKSLL